MNGLTAGSDASRSESDSLSKISYALEATYNPRSSNEARKDALQFLEEAKKQPDAPQHGFTLANDHSQQPAVRHFGLSLLEFAIRYRYEDYSEEQATTLQQWVLSLARDIEQEDAQFYRNKVGHLWVEIAKRSWAGTWMDMDSLLVALWDTPDTSKQVPYRILVLYILECLSDDICVREDPIAGLRQDVLGQSLNEVVIPAGLYTKHLEVRGHAQNVRYQQEGWLARICSFVSACMSSNQNQVIMSCALRSLESLKSIVTWISLSALIETQIMDCLFQTLASQNVAAQTAAIEVVNGIVSRPYNAHFHESWATLIRSTLQPDRVELMRNTFASCLTSADDIDEPKYTIQKKLSEVLSVLGDAAAQNPDLLQNGGDTTGFLALLIAVFQSESLLVSIPILHSFTRLLQSKDPQLSNAAQQHIGALLNICSARLLKYESVQQDDENPIMLYLNEDFENLPELHAFLGNYRRYCVGVIEIISQTLPREALAHILDETIRLLDAVATGPEATTTPSAFKKNAPHILQFDAQTTVVRSALNGYMQWCSLHGTESESTDQKASFDHTRDSILAQLRTWCERITTYTLTNPDIARPCIQTVVHIVTRVLPAQSDLIIALLNYLFNQDMQDDPNSPEYSDAVRTFQSSRMQELQRVAMAFPDYLLDVYSELEARINNLISSGQCDSRVEWGLRAFLLIIIHRATAIDQQARLSRLQDMTRPVIQGWQDPDITKSLSSFADFCGMVGLGGLPDFISAGRFSTMADWSQEPLNQDGRALQADILAKSAGLPLRMTNSLLGATTERLKESTVQYDIGAQLWGPAIQAILPNLLAMLKHATAFSNMKHWSFLPPELQSVVQKMLVDRFWQSGISNESRDDFYARISASAFTYEGLASTVRGTPRSIRDACYHILHGMTRFEEQFYGLNELPEPLADALLSEAHALSVHHLSRVLALVEKLVERCPPHHRHHFLPPLLIPFFTQMDSKISAEWEIVETAKQQSTEEDQLSDEMKNESILRSTTYSMVMFVSTLLDHRRSEPTQEKSPLRVMILSNPTILEPLIMFCTHALRMRDSRCCTMICRVLRSMVPVFRSDDAPAPQVREFICTEVLRACIMSLNEPYFADVQRDLANLIANIIVNYAPKTATPRNVLLSLPDMGRAKVERAIQQICEASSERKQRALVLEVLEGVRGVSIHEAGKIDRRDVKQKRSAMQQQFMETDQKAVVQRGGSPGLEGMADMFGDV